MTYSSDSSLPNIVPPEVLVFQNVLDLFLEGPPNTLSRCLEGRVDDDAEIGPPPPFNSPKSMSINSPYYIIGIRDDHWTTHFLGSLVELFDCYHHGKTWLHNRQIADDQQQFST